MLKLTARDKTRLKGVHPDLIKVLDKYLEIGTVPIIVIEGMRTLATQKKYLARGATTTLRSRHLTGHAIDIGPRDTPLSHWPPYYKIAEDFKKAAKLVGVTIEWGGDWRKFKDGPHWQLPWNKYPANMPAGSNNTPVAFVSTEGTTAVSKASMLGIGGFGGSSVAIGDSFSAISSSIENQQYELSSGDLIRVGIAIVILGTTLVGLYLSWRNYKNSQASPEMG